MTNDLIQKISIVVLLLTIFLGAYAIFYAAETKKTARQLNIVVPRYIRILIATPVGISLLGFIIVIFLFISTFLK